MTLWIVSLVWSLVLWTVPSDATPSHQYWTCGALSATCDLQATFKSLEKTVSLSPQSKKDPTDAPPPPNRVVP